MPDFDDLIGKCFADGGRGPDSFDCWGLAVEVMSRYGIKVPDYNIAAFACKSINRAIEDASSTERWRRRRLPQPGRLVVIKNHPRFVNHVGVCIGNGKFIHVLKNINVSIHPLNGPNWKKRTRGFYSYHG